jgi:hypothetical protein
MHCSRCITSNKENCYHHQVCNTITLETVLADLEDSLAEFLSKYGKHYEEVMSKTKLSYDHTMANHHSCVTHIDYVILWNDPQKIGS